MYCLLSLYPDFFYVVCRVGRVVPAGRVIVCCRGARVRTHECWEYLMLNIIIIEKDIKEVQIMNFKKIAKIVAIIVALVSLAAAVYVAVKKLTAKKEPEYFDDNEFFECDNEIEIVDVSEEAKAEKAEEEPKKKAAPKKKSAPKKKASENK